MPVSGIGELREGLRVAMAGGDRAAAVSLAVEAVASGGVSIPVVYEVLGSLLTELGDSWRSGSTEVWREHIASAVARTFVEALYPMVAARAHEADRGTVVLACPENESHDLGLRMISDRFELAGWRVRYLGADTPASEIAAAALDAGARLIVLSVSTHYHRIRIRETVRVLEVEAPGIRVVVGGPAFFGTGSRDAGEHASDLAEFLGDEARGDTSRGA